MNTVDLGDQIKLEEFLEQINYALSLEFKEKWRHKYSEAFVGVFQNVIIEAFKNQKPVKLSFLNNQFIKKHGYDKTLVKDFLQVIDVTLYSPLIYQD